MRGRNLTVDCEIDVPTETKGFNMSWTVPESVPVSCMYETMDSAFQTNELFMAMETIHCNYEYEIYIAETELYFRKKGGVSRGR